MATSKIGEAPSQPNKHHTKYSSIPLTKETPRASMSELSLAHFPRYYILPRNDTKKPINLLKDAKYDLVEPKILAGVIVEEDLLGLIPSLKYVDHDITN